MKNVIFSPKGKAQEPIAFLSRFNQGVKLKRKCNGRLAKAWQKDLYLNRRPFFDGAELLEEEPLGELERKVRLGEEEGKPLG